MRKLKAALFILILTLFILGGYTFWYVFHPPEQIEQLSVRKYSDLIQDSPQDAHLYHNRALSYLSQHKLNLAKTDLIEALKWSPNDIDSLYTLAQIHERQGNTKAAQHMLNQVLSKQPKHKNALLSKLWMQKKAGSSVSQKALKMVYPTKPASAKSLSQLRIHCILNPQENLREDFLDLLNKQEPQSAQIQGAYGQCLYELKNYKEALVYLDKALNKYPLASWFYSRAKVYQALRDETKSDRDYNQALKLSPYTVSYHLDFISELTQRKQYKKALFWTQHGLKHIKDSRLSLMQIKLKQSLLPKYNPLKDLNISLTESPWNGSTYSERAKYFIQNKQYLKAQKDLKSVIQQSPSDPLPYLTLAQTYALSKNNEEAKDILTQIKKRFPHLTEKIKQNPLLNRL